MYICAMYLFERNKLEKDTVVATVMSNLGFYKALERQGVNVVTANVGDRYVMEKMREESYNLGGEQSGHIIFLNYSTSGDGMLSAIQLVNIMKETGKPLSELAAGMRVYPQKLKNIQVIDKDNALHHPVILDEIARVEKELDGTGRVLVRPSGTEPLIRVMVEAETEEACEKYVNELIDVVDRHA